MTQKYFFMTIQNYLKKNVVSEEKFHIDFWKKCVEEPDKISCM
jgi:hypothetical protein